ncbi:MAG: F0F1 ATP synthase subunit A [Alistipes sp.]|nr:F0F1 ATP synthase subunit A [Alistipes sp.]
MIKKLQEVHLGGTTVYITTTHVALLCVSLFIIVLAVIANRVIVKADPDATPGAFQNAVEIVVEMLGNMVNGLMGTNAKRFVNYISSIFIFILICNISGLFGLRPPTADYGVTLPLALFTFCIIHFCGIKKNKVKHFTNLFQPVAILFPINVISEIATPLSLSVRLFGNIMSGTVLMGLVYGMFPLLLKMGIPAVMHVYFDIFSGCIQAYVFAMLTMVYVNDKIAD